MNIIAYFTYIILSLIIVIPSIIISYTYEQLAIPVMLIAGIIVGILACKIPIFNGD